jgi:uncharacterized membrane protein (DUF485 family)
MGLLAPLASLLGVEVETLLERAKGSAVAFAAIGLFGLICLYFLLVALYTWLTGWLGPIWSPLIIAAAALVIAIVLYVALHVQQAALQRRAEERRREAQETALVAGAALSALPDLLRSPLVRNVGLPLALYAGFLLFSSSGKRKK